MNNYYTLLGRAGLAAIFILSGWGKISGYAGTQEYMASAGVPGALLPLVILLEVGGGLAILSGAFTRWLAPLFAIFAVASAVLFHGGSADQVSFLKNIAIAGGFLVLAAHGSGAFSVDALLAKRLGSFPSSGRVTS